MADETLSIIAIIVALLALIGFAFVYVNTGQVVENDYDDSALISSVNSLNSKISNVESTFRNDIVVLNGRVSNLMNSNIDMNDLNRLDENIDDVDNIQDDLRDCLEDFANSELEDDELQDAKDALNDLDECLDDI